MYFACFSPIPEDHNTKQCRNRKTCNICKQKHLSFLHGYVPKRAGVTTQGTVEEDKNLRSVDNGRKNSTATDLKSAFTGITSKISSMCVVPIRVSHGETKKEISTYAMLANCSQGCFIKENVKRRFGVTGSKTAIIIKTLNGEQENNGSNFVRPERELAKSIGEMDQQKISEYLLERKTDWIVWEKNPVFLSSLASLHER